MYAPTHMLRKARYTLRGWFNAMRLPAGIVQQARGKIILCYHGIDYCTNTSVNTKFISTALFEQHLQLLKKHTNLVSLQQYIDNDVVPDRLNVAITFDDGFKNNYTLARPLLEKYNVPATFFITPVWQQGWNILWPDLVDYATPFAPDKITIAGDEYSKGRGGRFFYQHQQPIHSRVVTKPRVYIEELYKAILPYAKFMQKPEMDVYWQLMEPDVIQQLSKNSLFTIGSHSYTHTSLTALNEAEAMHELAESRRVLEELIQKPVDFYAAPFGHFNNNTLAYGRKAGYTFQVVEMCGHSACADKDIANRLTINPYISAGNQLRYISNGQY